MRDEFSVAVKEQLAKRVAYLCSNPGCRQPTSGPTATPAGTVNIGVAAHVTAASPGGARYDADLQPEARSAADNGIWLCQTCAKLIDSDVRRYSIEKLREWRSDAEAAAAQALEQRRTPPTESQGVFHEAQRLMPDLIAEMKQDLRDDESELVREFVVLPSEHVVFGHNKPRFVYVETKHPNLQIQVDWLEEMGLVIDVTPRSTPIYRFTPEFAEWLRQDAS